MTTVVAQLRRRFTENALLKNTLTLISGTVATQAIVFVFSPLLSRIFPVVDFGNLANYNAWVAILVMLSNLRYEQAIIVAKGREKTNSVVVLTALLVIGGSVVYALIAAAIALFYSGGGYLRDLKHVVSFIPLGVLVTATTSLFMQYNVKTGRFKLMASAGAAQVIFTVGPQITLGLLHVHNALIIGTIVGFVFSSAVYGWFFFQEHRFAELWVEMRPRQLIATATEHLKFPRFMLLADMISVVVQQFVPVFVLALFNPVVAGLYAFSVRVVRVPMIVISAALTGALRKEAVDQVHAGRGLSRMFTGTVGSLALVSVIPFVVTLLFGKAIFVLVFGHQWLEAGRIVQILSPGILVEFVALPLSAFFLATNTQQYTFAVQAVGFVLLITALFCGKYYFHDFIETCYLVSAAMIIVNLLTIALAARVSGVKRRAAAVVVT